MGLAATTPPASEPIATATAKSHLRVDISDDDALIGTLVTVARQDTENVTWRQLITATYTLTMDHFPLEDYIDLPRPPLQSVTSVSYVDGDGNTQTFSSSKYTVDTATTPGRIFLNYGESWPTTRVEYNAVTIVYVAGYGDAGSDVPDTFLHSILMKVGHWYEHREAITGMTPKEVPMGAAHLDSMNKFRGRMNSERWIT